MIDINLVKQAKSIRDKHIKTIDKYNNITKVLNEYENKLISYKDDIDKIDVNEENIENTKKALDIMEDFELTINNLSNKVKPIIKELEDLKKQSNLLYNKIKENHPNKNDDELKEQLFKQLGELNSN